MGEFRVTRGEINQTVYRRFISSDSSGARLLKGVEIGPFCLRERLSQGKREWFDEDSFLREHEPRAIVQEERIATQRITGVDKALRIVATIVSPPTYFADSTNSICRTRDSSYALGYLLGLLNSRLFQWRFRLTSTNNNVGTNELDCLPIRTLDFSDANDVECHKRMVAEVARMRQLHVALAKARTPHHRTSTQRRITATDSRINRLVYELYGLTDDEIAIVEGAGR